MGIYIQEQETNPEDELRRIVANIQKWLPLHQDKTAAVLVPRNDHGARIVGILKENNLPYIEMLRSTSATRKTASVLTAILRYLSDPVSITKFTAAFKQRFEFNLEGNDQRSIIAACAAYLKNVRLIENLLYPQPGSVNDPPGEPLAPECTGLVTAFVESVRSWAEATLLPIDQLVITIAQGVFTNAIDLALAHKLALLLEAAAASNPKWNLPDFVIELEKIASNERKFLGFSDLDQGFNPDDYKGKVVVSTIHKAKGLEWDRVYLCSVNNFDFPSCQPGDTFLSEKWFVRGKLNLEAEMLLQLKSIFSEDFAATMIEEGFATQQSRLDYAAERLRLLYVGITRARRELIITWNTGRRRECKMAVPVRALINKRMT